ncbi:MAG: pyridoxal-phosphate dependent enzyme [Spirochaetales bacterium]|nr:pyridoxal-phosphate dependent enzyme [Spirochaetales bacterium]
MERTESLAGIQAPSLAEIRRAAGRIAPHAHRTPVLTCRSLDELVGARLYFKCENFQKVGAFKFRGACNAVLSLGEEEARRGVATHSSGNHAQALALAARLRGIPAHIVMPRNSPRVKVAAVQGYGARILFCPPTQADRERTLEAVVRETGAAFVHPYDDLRVIAGQATCALELLEEVPGLELVLAPVGGGGLVSGTALSCRYLAPAVRVLAAEPKGADDAFRSLRDGRIHPSVNPRTVADGLRTSLGSLTFPIIRETVSAVLTVEEESILRAMRLIWERMKIIVEPSAAVPLGALLEWQHAGSQSIGGRLSPDSRIGIILSGGNLDLDRLPWSG